MTSHMLSRVAIEIQLSRHSFSTLLLLPPESRLKSSSKCWRVLLDNVYLLFMQLKLVILMCFYQQNNKSTNGCRSRSAGWLGLFPQAEVSEGQQGSAALLRPVLVWSPHTRERNWRLRQIICVALVGLDPNLLIQVPGLPLSFLSLRCQTPRVLM